MVQTAIWLVLLIPLAAGLAVLLATWRRGRRLAAVGLGMAAGLAVMALFVVGVRSAHRREITVTPPRKVAVQNGPGVVSHEISEVRRSIHRVRGEIAEVQREVQSAAGNLQPLKVPQPLLLEGERWSVEISDDFTPNVFPSAQSAARSLVRRALQLLPPEKGTVVIRGKAERAILDEAGKALSDLRSELNVLVRPEIAGSDKQLREAAPLLADLEFASSPTGTHTILIEGRRYGHREGTLRLCARVGKRERLWTTSFVDKLWADDFSKWTQQWPREGWMIAGSPSPRTDAHEAERQAKLDAAHRLLPEIQRTVGTLGGWRIAERDPNRLAALVADHLDSGPYIADRFLQKYDRPYGAVWRCSLLVDASSDSVRRLAVSCRRDRQIERSSWVRTLGSIGALFGVICAVYLFLNAATKGYYVWSLRVLVALAVLGGGAATLWMLA
ncbi:MAG: hypothetical protein JXQ73_20275 [Phycisphaerae bacterium]|nr:hypothetical protein [Phycisphaerae bacterium]